MTTEKQKHVEILAKVLGIEPTDLIGGVKVHHLSALEAMRIACEDAEAKLEKANKFKSYVHSRLDDAGIEKEPNGEHSKHGCRIGDRLDIILSELTALRSELERVRKERVYFADYIQRCVVDRGPMIYESLQSAIEIYDQTNQTS